MRETHCLNPIAKCGTELFPAGYRMTGEATDTNAVPVHSASMYDMELPGNLLAVGRAEAGINDIPLDSCAQKGIVVLNVPGTNASGVKELVIAGMLIASHDIASGIKWCKANAEDDNITEDTEKSKKALAGCEIKDKRLGAIDPGTVETEVADAVTHLGMEVYGYDPYISISTAWRLSRSVKHIANADIVFQGCDYIAIHVPFMDSTRGMISKEGLTIVRNGVVILNFSRDTLANDDSMAEAPGTGKVRYYVSDFPDPRVANMERVILLPRLGASVKGLEDSCAVMIVKELTDYLENGNIKNPVNLPSRDMSMCRAESHVAVLRMNIPNMIGQVTAVLAEQDINISDMTNKSRDKRAYTPLDLEHKIEDPIIRKLRVIKGMLRIRVAE